MLQIPTSKQISCDHTFKVAANIGYLRQDGTWVHQYDSLFLVMNANRQELTWQFTKGTSFSQIQTLLTDLKERAPMIETVYVDDCCKLRSKITTVFGCETSVKLDLFHTTQRITRTLYKRHPLADRDSGDKRMSATPSPEIILSKLNTFVEKWKYVQDGNGKTSDTVTATDRLKHHVLKGCISYIPPGAGTNRNEHFHGHINSHFNRSKMGILLAYALLTVIIRTHNLSEKVNGRSVNKTT